MKTNKLLVYSLFAFLYTTICFSQTPPIIIIIEDVNNDGQITLIEINENIDIQIDLPLEAIEGDFIRFSDGNISRLFQLTAVDISNMFITTDIVTPVTGTTISVTASFINVMGESTLATDTATIFIDYFPNGTFSGTVSFPISAMSFNDGSNVAFNTAGATDILPNGSVDMVGLIARGQTQAQIEAALAMTGSGPAGNFDSFNPPGPNGPINVTEGSYFQLSLNMALGDVFSVDFNFLSPEIEQFIDDFQTQYVDVAYVVINGEIHSELKRATDVGGSDLTTIPPSWETFSYTATQTGTLDISFVIFNGEDANTDSGLALDNAILNKNPIPISVVSVAEDTGVFNDAITSDNTLFFNGTSEANNTIDIFLDGLYIGTTTTNGLGDWSFDYTSTILADGLYSIMAQARDSNDILSFISAPLNIEIDTSTLGLQDFSKDYLSIYPNPVRATLYIKNGIHNFKSVEVFSILGEKIRSLNVNETNLELDVSQLSKGVYFLKIDQQTIKFIKN